MSIRCRFSFEPVGQGLFYTGQIGKLNLIYDCGSMRGAGAITPVIDRYVNGLSRKQIDMLFISHLDKDHVCGIDHLIGMKKTKVRSVYLPYMLPSERLLLACRAIGTTDEFYFELIADPVSYFIERGADRVVLINGTSPDDMNDSPNPFEGNPGDNISFDDENMPEQETINLQEDSELRDLVSKHDPSLVGTKKVLFRNCKGEVLIPRIWVFRLLAVSARKDLTTFINCVNTKFKLRQTLDQKKVRDILTDPAKRALLKDCYKKAYGHLNNTSLMVFHGPIFNSKIILATGIQVHRNLASSTEFHWTYYSNNDTLWGTMLTGDIDFKWVWNDFVSHFANYIPRTTNILIPHHGSIRNWDKRILNTAQATKTWYVSAGIGNSHRHPDLQVILDVHNSGGTVFCSNEIIRVFQEGWFY